MTPQEDKVLRALGRSLRDRLSADTPGRYSKHMEELMATLRQRDSEAMAPAQGAAGAAGRSGKPRGTGRSRHS
jgi:hypothetical protein